MSDLIFVYALDGGLFNEITGYAHKMFSPKTYPCNLCTLTNGPPGAKREWTEFVRGLGVKTEFLHRDKFVRQYPSAQHSFPAVFRSTGSGAPEVLVTSEELKACRDLPALMSLVHERIKNETATR